MLLGFKKIYVDKIKDGSKTTTIRTLRKIKPKIGEKIFMYSGLRTSNCQKIGEATVSQVYDIKIQAPEIYVNEVKMDLQSKNNIARNDGFDCPADLFGAICNTYGAGIFHGSLIVWDNFKTL